MPVIHKTFSVANIRIQTSADTIERNVARLNGIYNVSVSIASSTMTVDFNPELVNEKQIIETVRDCGYIAYTHQIPIIREESNEEPDFIRPLMVPLGACGMMLVFWVLKAPLWLAWIPLAATVFTVPTVLKHVVESVKERSFDSCVLAVFSALIATMTGLGASFANRTACGFFFYAASILVCANAILNLLEHNEERVRHPLDEVQRQLPVSASVFEDHTEHQKNLAELRKDQVIVVRPGEIVPADGRVVHGFAVMNESALTGTDLAIEKSIGSYVYANSRCISGSVNIKAERIGHDTAMMQFARLAENTASDDSFRTPFRSYEYYLMIFILITGLISMAGWLYMGKDIFFAITVFLGVLCCASFESIAIAASNAVMHAAREAAARHVLFRNVKALEQVGLSDAVIMEQDGTVTEAEFVVTDFIPSDAISVGRFEYIVYALESRNNKPFARAITHYLRGRRITSINPEEFARLGAHGRQAVNTMSRFSAGSPDEIEARGISTEAWTDLINQLYVQGKRIMVFTEDDQIIGLIAAIKPMIPDCEKAFEQLKQKDVAVTLITSSTWESSEILKKHLAPDAVVHNPTSIEKENLLRSIHTPETTTTYITSGYVSAMHDVDLTVAISAGTEIDQDNADILLTRNRLEDFVYAMNLSTALNERIQQVQVYLILYHIGAGLLFGFVLPLMTGIALPPVFAAVMAYLVMMEVLRESAGISPVEETEQNEEKTETQNND